MINLGNNWLVTFSTKTYQCGLLYHTECEETEGYSFGEFSVSRKFNNVECPWCKERPDEQIKKKLMFLCSSQNLS